MWKCREIRSSNSRVDRDHLFHGNQIILQKYSQRRLIPLAFGALVLENELQYHCLVVRINSINDASISCENFVKFGTITPEVTELICERHVRHGKKTGVFRWISPDILDRFSQSFYHMKALYVLIPYFLIFQWTLPWQPNNVAVMKANWYYVHSLHVRQMWARCVQWVCCMKF